MSDTDEEEIDDVPPDDDGDDDGEGRPKKRGRKRLIILIAAPLLVIILLVVGAVVMGIGPFGGGADEEETATEESHGAEGGGEHGAEGEHGEGGAGHVGFYELPQMTVNLNTTDGTTSFLRLTVSLELANDTPETRAQLDAMLPRVIDNFQVYMRELRLDDLSGSAGLFRLKQELLSRTNRAVDPVKVSDVLFSELLVQ